MQRDKYSLKAFDDAVDAVKADCEHLLTDDGTSIMFIDRQRWQHLSKLDIDPMLMEKDVTPHVSGVIFENDGDIFKWYIPTCCIEEKQEDEM
jgi:hypothetical protein